MAETSARIPVEYEQPGVATAGATIHTEFAIDADRARPAVIAAAAIFARGIAHD